MYGVALYDVVLFVYFFFPRFLRRSPPIESRSLRYGMLNEHHDVIGPTKAFDGSTLFLPNKITDTVRSRILLLSL